jgi:DNA modification methylase
MPGHWFTAGTALYGLDCRAVLPVLKDASVDSVVTDPPYELTSGKKGGTGEASLNLGHPAGRSRITTGGGFMGHDWDATGVPMDPDFWREVLRVLKPGGHLVAFGGTRTYHRMAVAIEDAGFEIRDSLHWLYGSGFPKGLDVSKAIDKAAGARREAAGIAVYGDGHVQNSTESIGYGGSDPAADRRTVTLPATDAARQWEGWNVALKPAHEPVVLARKPFRGTVAQNVLEHGTGALNIGATRVGTTRGVPASLSTRPPGAFYSGGIFKGQETDLDPNMGRWPPNVLLTHAIDCQAAGAARGESGYEGGWGGQAGLAERKSGLETVTAYACAPGCPVAGLDGQSGNVKTSLRSKDYSTPATNEVYGKRENSPANPGNTYGDTGGASRFFPQLDWSPEYDLPFLYQAKAPKSERPVIEEDGRKIVHSTVKPLALMRWLARLVTPPGGVVLDPFCGTGTTLQAAGLEGFRSIGCDSWDDAIALARVRLQL